MMHPLEAQALGYKTYPEFRMEDESTYTHLCEDAYTHFTSCPAVMNYYCWVPKYGLITIKRNALGGKYAVPTA